MGLNIVPLAMGIKLVLMAHENPGIGFEKIVAAIQARMDPSTQVTHNEVIVDRLGHSRQFDVVIRGIFAGRELLGAIECKDMKRRVGTPEVDAFHTKASEIKANLKIIVSRNGFTKSAIEKCQHYGIETLSLLQGDPINRKFRFGATWYATISSWSRLDAHFFIPGPPIGEFDLGAVTIDSKRVFDWFMNHLRDLEKRPSTYPDGGIHKIRVDFKQPQNITFKKGVVRQCSGILLEAYVARRELEYFAGLEGDGFYDWQTDTAKMPANIPISTSGPLDFSLWSPRSPGWERRRDFFSLHMHITENVYEHVPDAIDLMAL